MSGADARVDALRERLLARELSEARAMAACHGAPVLVQHALFCVREGMTAHARFSSLSREVEAAPPDARRAHIARFLREACGDRRTLREDLRELQRGRKGVLDLGALGERTARQVDALECSAEACLAIAAGLAETGASGIAVPELLELAETPGRWSRRIEALHVLRRLIRAGLSADARALALAATKGLVVHTEQRWVQPAALFALAMLDVEAAHAVARERLRTDRGGDDFLVRSLIVRLVARFRKAGWHDLVELAAADPSELVRMSAVQVEWRPAELERLACSATGPKLRALALIRLCKRAPAPAWNALARGMIKDANAFVVETAAQEMLVLARRSNDAPPAEARHALWSAARRLDLPSATLRACRDALLELDVLSGKAQALHSPLAAAARATAVGASTRITDATLAQFPDDDVARALAVLARDDFALGVDRVRDGFVLHRGGTRGFAPWRVLFEALHPGPSKRQAVAHTLGHRPRGALRAPPGGLAEVTATRVPGERVLAEPAGDWGRHLPLVDDLLSSGILSSRPSSLASSFGITRVTPAPSLLRRVRAWFTLSSRYAQLVELRQRGLNSRDREVQLAYVREVERVAGISIELLPYAFDLGAETRELPRPTGLDQALSGMTLASLLDRAPSDPELLVSLHKLWDDVADYALSPGGNRLPHLAAYGIVLLGAMMTRTIAIRHSIEGDRKAIPLVMGGWGTRGKSGTERLKAALFQGLGYETLVKTTGCEAMFIHAIPGLPAREVFIYRPYDKATVWEQRELLSLARRFGVRVFLWECMALQPDLVNLLQAQWMHDDCSTITNAYPDHEDVQGPTGFDVATTISEFVPAHGRLFTSEEQMLPVLAEKAKARGTKLAVVRARDGELIAEDLLARFSYAEHPRNIALVAALARGFGIASTIAIAEMADNVVPDLGALKTYPAVPWCGRTLSFTNGMGANDRAGTLGNWRRSGFAAHDPDTEPARFIVTVVNNRADRIARSEVFAKLLVEDISAHRHVLIGSNVNGLLGFIEQALQQHLERSRLSRDLPNTAADRRRVAGERIAQAFLRLKVGRTDAESVIAQCAALSISPLDRTLVEGLLSYASPDEGYAASREQVRQGLTGVCDVETLPFLTSMIARRRALRALQAFADERVEADPAALDLAFTTTYRALFAESLVPLHDSALSGDAIIDRITAACPPGAAVAIMGVQNIKGTGLDFVYRWVSVDIVQRMLSGLTAPTDEAREQALTQLMIHDDYGKVDATLALAAVESARKAAPADTALPYESVITRLREVVKARTERAAIHHKTGAVERLRKTFGETFDFIDAIRRRRMAIRVVNELASGLISHATAAGRMRAIVARSKGAWMRGDT